MRSRRFLFASPLLRALLLVSLPATLAFSVANCGSDEGGDPGPQPQPDSSTTDDTSGTDADSPETDGSTGEVGDGSPTGDTGTTTDTAKPDTGPPPVVTCKVAPVFSAAIRVNHNLDSLRRVQTAGMVLLEDGRIMVAMLEALDTTTRYGVFARIVDPITQKSLEDERLDVDADNLTAGSVFDIVAVPGGAVAVRYGDGHGKVFSGGKWSPDIASVLPASNVLTYLAAPNGDVLVTRARGAAPYGEATVYRPNEGGTKGSWSAAATLDLDAATAQPTIRAHVLPDGRFMTLIWQGSGGPAIRTRSLSGAWSTAYAKPEIGALDTTPDYRILADGSIVLVALETIAADTKRVVTSTWTAADGWTPSRLLSKPTATANGVIPVGPSTVLYDLAENEVEFVAWVAAPCTGSASECTFDAVSRRYTAGAWQDPIKLAVGTGGTGSAGLTVQNVAGKPVVVRRATDGTKIELRTRYDETGFKPVVSVLANTVLFGGNQASAQIYGAGPNLWALVRRDPITDAGTDPPIVAEMGRIDQTGAISWGEVRAGSYELRTLDQIFPYADGAGGFTVGANNATNGTAPAAIIARSGSAGGTPEAAVVQTQEESGASFVAWPRQPPRPGRDRSALFVVGANYTPTDDAGVPGTRLRAYGFNGVGGRAPKILALSDKAPRHFGANSLLAYGCGGAAIYAVDPTDGSHALEIVFMGEPSGGDGGL